MYDELTIVSQLDRVLLYKTKYAQLHEVVLATYEHEKSLLAKARQLNYDLVDRKVKLEKRALEAAEESAKLQQLKKELDDENLDVANLEEQSSMLKYEIEELNRNKDEINEDLANRVSVER